MSIISFGFQSLRAAETTGYGGIGEMGGNKILLESDDGSLFLDFGRDFDTEAAYFD